MRESVVVLFAVLFSTPLSAQTTSLEPGTPLRVSARGFTIAGDLVRWDADSLVVYSGVSGSAATLRAERAIAAGDILGVEALVHGSRGRRAARGALWGAVIGSLAGGVIGAADPPSADHRTHGALLGGAVFGALGAGVGALVGLSSPTEKWAPVLQNPAQR